jgi:serine/threonine protein kinase/Tol biopolymer transport system component
MLRSAGDAQPSDLRFGAFELDFRQQELRKEGLPVRLAPQPFKVLAMLVAHAGQMVTRKELQEQLWGDSTFVDFDVGLNRCIRQIRAALDDGAEEPRFVETLPRRGYRLIVPVEKVQPQGADSTRTILEPRAGAAAADNTLIGKRVSHYRVLGLVGAGGMGVVYKAEDVKLGRRVALKFLSEEVARDGRTLERFAREARTASALNHPNICTIHEVEEHEAQPFIVMELLEGDTLSQRIARRPLPIEELLELATQICTGLGAAHSKGIVHRDVKPSNIFITTEGVAKILDFGLAKLTVAAVSDRRLPGVGDEATAGVGDAATIGDGDIAATAMLTASSDPAGLTHVGAAMGTAPYMSPEQVRGEELDACTDLFSFGAVLYEMATGRTAFRGATFAETRDAILSRDVTPLGDLDDGIDPRLKAIIEKSLEKDRDLRYQHASEIRADLKRLKRDRGSGPVRVALDPPSSGHAPVPTRAPQGVRQRVVIGVAVLVMAAVVVLALHSATLQKPKPKAGPTRFSIPPPEGYAIAPGPWAPEVAVSPDGRAIAVVLADSKGTRSLWVRPLDAEGFQRFDNTDGADLPFWSPDSQFIGFFADGKLKKIPLAGGTVQTVCEAEDAEGGTWSGNGVILYGYSQRGGPVMRVDAAGGEPIPVTHLQKGFGAHVWPQFLPDRKHFLYLALSENPANESLSNSVFVGSVDSAEVKLVLKNASAARFYPPGYLLVVREGNLLAQRFDAERMELRGKPVQISENVAGAYWGRAAFSISDTGVLAFRAGPPGDPGETAQLSWRDREGAKLADVGLPGPYVQAALSPDGKLVVVEGREGSRDHLELLDLSNGILSLLTSGAGSQMDPVWSRDSHRILYATHEKSGDPLTLMELQLGSSRPTKLYSDGSAESLDDWSPNGKFLIYHDDDDVTFHFLSLDGLRLPVPVVHGRFHRDQFQFSPDGKWVAYNSDESGGLQTYVASFPTLEQKHLVSNGGGGEPIWRADGKEVYYLGLDWTMMAVTVKTDGSLETGPPRVLFRANVLNPFGQSGGHEYSVTGDGQKFLLLEPAKDNSSTNVTPEQINVIVNWDAGLPR